jgi:hypothetical protein
VQTEHARSRATEDMPRGRRQGAEPFNYMEVGFPGT